MLAAEAELEIIGDADGGAAAVEAIASKRPDLVFLDVQMPGLDGFGVLRCTAGAHRPVVVFVTAHDQHAIRAFEINAADYLLKPVSAPRLREAVRRAVDRVRSATPRDNATALDTLLTNVKETPASGARIPVRREDGILLVNVAEITWVEADGDHARLHAAGVVHSLRETMAELETTLQPFRFARVHRSAIVNLDAVRSVEPIAKGDYHLVLRDGTRVRSGRSYRQAVQALIR
jgi:two-component system LytT family response regulator